MNFNNFIQEYDFYGRPVYNESGQRLYYIDSAPTIQPIYNSGTSNSIYNFVQPALSKEEQLYYYEKAQKEAADRQMSSFVEGKLKDNYFELYFFVGHELAYPGFLVTWNLLTMAPTDICGILDTDKLPKDIFKSDAPIYEIDEVVADWLIENNHAFFEDNMPKSKMINFIWSMISEYVIELSALTAED